MTELEEYLHDLIVAEMRSDVQHGDLHIEIVDAIVRKLARYIRSCREGLVKASL